jgi:hypothetical protein
VSKNEAAAAKTQNAAVLKNIIEKINPAATIDHNLVEIQREDLDADSNPRPVMAPAAGMTGRIESGMDTNYTGRTGSTIAPANRYNRRGL